MIDDEYLDTVLAGDVFERMAELPDDSIHIVMFSPPYWQQRDYHHEEQIGCEDQFSEYLQKMVTLGDEVKRVLRDDGSWWLNLGDGYVTTDKVSDKEQTTEERDHIEKVTHPRFNYKSKMMMPSRIAIALVDAGWRVRNDIPWIKTNAMPESATDRLSTRFEFLYHLVPSESYYYDLDAIKEPYETDLKEEPPIGGKKHADNKNKTYSGNTPERTGNGKNPGDIIELPTDSFSGEHFAVYPPELCEMPVKATAPERVCKQCGTPHIKTDHQLQQRDQNTRRLGGRPDETTHTVTLEKQCDCSTDETEPGVVLDPMCGRGTTLRVASEHGCHYLGIELNPEFVEMARDYIPDTRQQTLTSFQ